MQAVSNFGPCSENGLVNFLNTRTNYFLPGFRVNHELSLACMAINAQQIFEGRQSPKGISLEHAGSLRRGYAPVSNALSWKLQKKLNVVYEARSNGRRDKPDTWALQAACPRVLFTKLPPGQGFPLLSEDFTPPSLYWCSREDGCARDSYRTISA